MPRAIAALVEKVNKSMTDAGFRLTAWERQKLDNHALDLQAREERVYKPGKLNNRATKRAKPKAKHTPGAHGMTSRTKRDNIARHAHIRGVAFPMRAGSL